MDSTQELINAAFTLETIAIERVISLASLGQSPSRLNWRLLPRYFHKVIESRITEKTLNVLRKDFGFVIKCCVSPDIIVLMGRGKCRGKGKPRKAKHLYAYYDAVYYETKFRLDDRYLDNMATIETQSLDYFPERHWPPSY